MTAITATNTATNTAAAAIGNTETRFLPMVGKTGKVSATSEKVALVLNNVNRDGLTALARDGKGAIGAQARKAVLGSAFGLPQMRAAARLERDQWGNALSLLVGEYGPQSLNRATMRGRDGTLAYLKAVERAALVRFDAAETAAQQERAMKAVQAIRADLDCMVHLVGVAEAEIMAQRAAPAVTAAAPAVTAPAAAVTAPAAAAAAVTAPAAAAVTAPAAAVTAPPAAAVTAPAAAAPAAAPAAKAGKAKKRAIA